MQNIIPIGFGPIMIPGMKLESSWSIRKERRVPSIDCQGPGAIDWEDMTSFEKDGHSIFWPEISAGTLSREEASPCIFLRTILGRPGRQEADSGGSKFSNHQRFLRPCVDRL